MHETRLPVKPAPEPARRRARPLLLASLLLAALALVAGCQQARGPRSPALPPGFADSRVPNVSLNAYVYLDQGQPVALAAAALGLSGGIASDLVATRLAAWSGPDPQASGVQALLSDEEGARALEGLAAALGEEVWTLRHGARVSIVRGRGQWSVGLRDALQSGTTVSFRETYPEAWQGVELLAESPPRPPVAAGVLVVDEALLKALSEAETPELQRLATALRVSSASGMAFAVYAAGPLVLSTEVGAGLVREADLRIAIVVRTSLVGPLLGAAMSTLAGPLNLQKVDVAGRAAYRYQQGDVTALLVAQGGMLYVVVAPVGAEGEELLAYLDLP